VVVKISCFIGTAAERGQTPCAKRLHEITKPLVGSTITPVVVFLPLVSVTGVTGSFFRALPSPWRRRCLFAGVGVDLDARG